MSSQTFQLPTSNSPDIIRNQVENQAGYKLLKSFFVKQGYEFVNARAQVFLSYSRENSSPSMLCIIPSLVSLDFKKDANHKAIGIVAFINNNQRAFLATEVLVNHKPFQIDSYTLYSLNDTKGVDQVLTVSKNELAKGDVATIGRKIKETKFTAKGAINASIPQEDFGFIISNSLSNFLNDAYNKASPADYKHRMMMESSLIEKYSQAIAAKQTSLAKAAGYCCSCTCCNGCTTTSTSFSLSL